MLSHVHYIMENNSGSILGFTGPEYPCWSEWYNVSITVYVSKVREFSFVCSIKKLVFLFSIFQAPNVACGVGFSNTCNTLMQHRGLSLYFSWYYYISSIIWYSHAQKPPTDTTGSAVAWTMHFSIILTPQKCYFLTTEKGSTFWPPIKATFGRWNKISNKPE